MSEKFFRCNCGCGGIIIDIFPEEWNIYISFLRCVGYNKSFSHRIKLVWEILRYGHHFDDDIFLTKETSKELGEALLKLSDKLEEK